MAEVKDRLEQTIKSFNITETSNSEESNEASQGSLVSQETTGEVVQLLPILYAIQDQIERLRDDILNKDTETIQAIVKATQPAPIEDSNTAIMKALLPEILKNPNSLKTLIELSERFKGIE